MTQDWAKVSTSEGAIVPWNIEESRIGVILKATNGTQSNHQTVEMAKDYYGVELFTFDFPMLVCILSRSKKGNLVFPGPNWATETGKGDPKDLIFHKPSDDEIPLGILASKVVDTKWALAYKAAVEEVKLKRYMFTDVGKFLGWFGLFCWFCSFSAGCKNQRVCKLIPRVVRT